MQYKATKRDGEPCGNRAREGSEFCRVHAVPSGDTVPIDNTQSAGARESSADDPDADDKLAQTSPLEVTFVDAHDVAMRTIASLLEMQREFSSPRHRLKKRFTRPFLATEKTVRKLHETAIGELERLGDNEKTLEVEVSYPGSESETFVTIDELFKSTHALPNSLSLTWQTIQADPISRNYITVHFDTGSSDSAWLPLKQRSAEFNVNIGGSEKDWCIVSKHKIEEQLELTKIPALYRWLQVFENQTVCYLGAYLMALFLASLVWSLSVSLTRAARDREDYESDLGRANARVAEYQALEDKSKAELDILRNEKTVIGSVARVEDTINRIVDNYYDNRIRDMESTISSTKQAREKVVLPQREITNYFRLFARELVPYFLGLVAIFAGHSLGQRFLPLLAPRSGIAIGEAAGKYADWENTFKFVVFTLIVSGMVVPLIRSLLW